MIEKYVNKISKEDIAQMPVEEFGGRIITLLTEKDADKAVSYLEKYSMIGFDTETKPSFKKGQRHKVALVQLSTDDTCFLFRLNFMGFPNSLKHLLCNDEVMKIGLSLRDDFGALQKRSNIQPKNFLDLQSYVGKFGIEEASLQKIYAILFNKKISKGQRLSNWEADILSIAQQKYASLDAWACLRIYNELNNNQSNINELL